MLQVIDADREVSCVFSLSDGHLPTLTGKAPVGITRLPYNHRSKAIQSILLDVTELSLKLPDELQNLRLEDDTKRRGLGALLVDAFGDGARVILLGNLVDGINEDVDLFASLIAYR